MPDSGDGEGGGGKRSRLRADLQGSFIFLPSFTGSLLLGFISGQFLLEITFAVTAAAGFQSVDTKVFGDVVLVDLVFEDETPFAEGLDSNQEEE